MSFFLPVKEIGTIICMARKKTPICVVHRPRSIDVYVI